MSPSTPPDGEAVPDVIVFCASRFVRALAAVVAPVPPLSKSSVPDIVIVPEDVIGPPEKLRPVVPPLTSTLETPPPPPPVEAIVISTSSLAESSVMVSVTFDPAIKGSLAELRVPLVILEASKFGISLARSDRKVGAPEVASGATKTVLAD
jgi:hypothetical protein